MPKYAVPVTRTVYLAGLMHVEANSLDDALDAARDKLAALPTDGTAMLYQIGVDNETHGIALRNGITETVKGTKPL